MTNKKSSCEKQLLFLEPKAGLEPATFSIASYIAFVRYMVIPFSENSIVFSGLCLLLIVLCVICVGKCT